MMGGGGHLLARCLLCSSQRLWPATRSASALQLDATYNPFALASRRWRSQSSKKWLERQEKDPYVEKAKKLGLPSRSAFKLQEIDEDHFPSLMAKARKKKGKGGNAKQPMSNRKMPKRLIQPDMSVLDLGAAPGGWSLYASTQLQPSLGGAVVAVDLLPLDETLRSEHSDIALRIDANLRGRFRFIQGDFTENNTRMQVMDSFSNLAGARGDDNNSPEEERNAADEDNDPRPALILSDMAPNFTGDAQTDALRTLNLCEQALAFAVGHDCFDPLYSSKDYQGMLAPGGSFLCKYFFCGRENEADLMDAAKRAFRSVHTIKPKASRKESSEVYLLALDYNCK